MFGLWRTFDSVVFYFTLAVGLGGLLGTGPVLWRLGFHVQRGAFSVHVLHLAAASFLFLAARWPSPGRPGLP
ncbi:hypothetical protein HPG69_017641 [Diceros bicornis minor]|uniref:Uncharacterized protein n=1 Tax=Diceros bicornis minor TaxID=77932 RepID=A0A7J7EP18_DICBM|nr:hypothetical protein HPG69_017641 [Diceros bicornis minor]